MRRPWTPSRATARGPRRSRPTPAAPRPTRGTRRCVGVGVVCVCTLVVAGGAGPRHIKPQVHTSHLATPPTSPRPRPPPLGLHEADYCGHPGAAEPVAEVRDNCDGGCSSGRRAFRLRRWRQAERVLYMAPEPQQPATHPHTHTTTYTRLFPSPQGPPSGKLQLAFTTTKRPKECGSCGSLLDAVCLQRA